MKLLRKINTSSLSTYPNGSNSLSGGGGGLSGRSGSSWVHLRSVLFIVTSSNHNAFSACEKDNLKSPWSHRRRKHALSPRRWKSIFTPDGKLCDGGVKFLKKVRSGGIHPSIRAEVWQFLLGMYELDTTQEKRDAIRTQKRKEYEKLRRQCRRLLKHNDEIFKTKTIGVSCNEGSESFVQYIDSSSSEDVVSARESLSTEGGSLNDETEEIPATSLDTSTADTDSSSDFSVEEPENVHIFRAVETSEEEESSPFVKDSTKTKPHTAENFATWKRTIRLDAVRANSDWVVYSPNQATVTEDRARRSAVAVGLKDYDHLEPCNIFHAARLVAILEAYAIYDTEIGYCQGMSDLLSPIIAVIEEDFTAFWCFVGFMKRARHNFLIDEKGIKRQLDTVAKIIKSKDSHLYRHLEKLEAAGCHFVYRMVLVLFRRELTFEQTICLWEVMWADQAANRAEISKSAWGRIRQKAPPTDDLLLYAIAACVLQRRKLIIEKYSSMDEIVKECNSMMGQLDVWKLLDDAHDLVVTLHDKI